jgi:hypothetical protein
MKELVCVYPQNPEFSVGDHHTVSDTEAKELLEKRLAFGAPVWELFRDLGTDETKVETPKAPIAPPKPEPEAPKVSDPAPPTPEPEAPAVTDPEPPAPAAPPAEAKPEGPGRGGRRANK